ncbi:MFS transporter [Pseudoxanthomonas broegbernensis]|uniref:MFS transporter n=1 Tax=Pseudoxanthomonas broegbernensis TaxID=83619 RepID=A0A7V8GLM9_9GAMM|nr:2-dehydro-3-deoxygalactonokinase [Pseudoxanthomonas broegbernensis]KAF1685921.1 MFS transporter [Pseudoxanthomonas broegbernensis]MBB6064151.1 2-dehydro-3-deoxygalactonokinase [Pseudoxanthomonas broegbernensis]
MIAVDWGGSSLRLYRLDDAGRIVDRRRSDDGALACQGRFGQVLAARVQDWDDRLIVLCGMVGARGGWIEMPYTACPAGLDALAAGMRRLDPGAQWPALAGRALWCVPGMADHGRDAADVMRGEETQAAGLMETLGPGTHRLCLPGTHSKWLQVRDGAVMRISTAMTGELYGLLRRHSILGRTMPADDPALDAAAFDAGLEDGRAGEGVLQDLFGVRTAALFGRFVADALPSYLSGLLIGHELRAALIAHTGGTVHLLGSDALLERYARALASMGVEVRRHDEDLAATGMYRLARARGL